MVYNETEKYYNSCPEGSECVLGDQPEFVDWKCKCREGDNQCFQNNGPKTSGRTYGVCRVFENGNVVRENQCAEPTVCQPYDLKMSVCKKIGMEGEGEGEGEEEGEEEDEEGGEEGGEEDEEGGEEGGEEGEEGGEGGNGEPDGETSNFASADRKWNSNRSRKQWNKWQRGSRGRKNHRRGRKSYNRHENVCLVTVNGVVDDDFTQECNEGYECLEIDCPNKDLTGEKWYCVCQEDEEACKANEKNFFGKFPFDRRSGKKSSNEGWRGNSWDREGDGDRNSHEGNWYNGNRFDSGRWKSRGGKNTNSSRNRGGYQKRGNSWWRRS